MLQKFIQSALILVVLFTTVQSYAQIGQSPEGIQFQALATDANDHPAAGRVIYVKDAIVAKTATGTIVYSETFKVTASSAGIFTIVLGKGAYASGVTSIANIDWANGPFFLNLKIAVEPTVPTASWNVNNEYVDLGTSQFWSVPYALYAGSVKGLDTKLNIADTAAMLKPYFTAINLKANIESPTFTGTVKGITKAMVGLANVDNTSDIDKPISTATQAALDLKANTADVTTSLALKANAADVTTALDLKVDKVTGKALSTNDYTTAEKTKLAAITGTNTGDQDLSALAVSADVNAGLALKANTADVNAALALKANAANVASSLAAKADVVNVNNAIAAINTSLNTKADAVAVNNSVAALNTSLDTKENASNKSLNIATDGASDVKYPSVKSIKTYVDAQIAGATIADADANTKGKIQLAGDLGGSAAAPTVLGLALKANTSDVNTSLSTKVDKVTGKDLSTNDYTTAEKDKLAAITGTNTGDQVNITGNAGTATKLQNARTINGVAFDGSGDITLPTSAAGIPYTGATQAVDLGAFDLKVNGLTIGRGNNRVDNNVAIGQSALSSTTTGFQGNYITAVGFEALKNDTWGYFNTGIGSSALFSNTTGLANTAVGSNSLYSNTTANYNTAVGAAALGSNTTGESNTATGNSSLKNNTTGEQNSAFGRNALESNTTGSINTATGTGALSANTVGGANTANGASALTSNLAGGGNTAMGFNALRNTNGSENTAIGNSAGSLNTTGTNNTAIGGYANFGANNLTNATALGYGATVAASNTIQLGADGTNSYTAVTLVKTSGTVNAGGFTTSGSVTAASYITSSDLRLKSNISPLANSLATVMQLNPVHYMKKGSLASTGYTREENGFIAQEIQKILPFIVTEGTDENKLLSVDYNSFIPMLTKAIQEQQKQIEDQNAKIAVQQKQIEELIKLMKELKK